jgi:hypothetical protein
MYLIYYKLFQLVTRTNSRIVCSNEFIILPYFLEMIEEDVLLLKFCVGSVNFVIQQ